MGIRILESGCGDAVSGRFSMSTHSPTRPDEAVGDDGPSLTRRQKFWLVVKVVEVRLRFVVLMAATGFVFAYWDTIGSRYEKWMRPAVERRVAASGRCSIARCIPTSCRTGRAVARSAACRWRSVSGGDSAPARRRAVAGAVGPGRVAQAGIATVEVAYAPLVAGRDDHRLRRLRRARGWRRSSPRSPASRGSRRFTPITRARTSRRAKPWPSSTAPSWTRRSRSS